MDTTTVSLRAESIDTRAVLAALQERVGPKKYNAWFKHGTTVAIVDGHIRVSVPNPFVANWIDSHYRGDIAAAVAKFTSGKRPVVISVDPTLSGELRKKQLDNQADIVARATQGTARRRRIPTPAPLRYYLKDFVVGESNRLAFSAAQAVVGGGAMFHPLFIHGSCGVGKTHLLQGICNAVTGAAGDGAPLTWRYVSGEQFTNEFVRALREKKFPEFRARYRNLDLLAIDDVHFLAAKKAIQEEFLHTFNAIEAAGKQIILASDAHPKFVGDLSAQLASRFVAGMVVKIESPDYDTRMEILRRKAKSMDIKVSPDVLSYVAHHIRGSARELEGTLFKLAAMNSLASTPISMDMARDALAEHLSRTDSVLTLGDIEAAVATFFGITPADIHSSRRTRTVSAARMVAMFLARRHTPMSYPEMGRAMGKNHSSVVLAVKRMETLLADKGDVVWDSAVGRKSMSAKTIVKMLNGQLS